MVIAEFSVDNEFIDPFGHLAEYGYYHYTIRALWQKCEEDGRLETFEKLGVGVVTLKSHAEFKSEVFKDEDIVIEEFNSKNIEKPKIWKTIHKILKKETKEVSFTNTSKMVFFKTIKGKIIETPKELKKPFFKKYKKD
tara:strand:- start:1580 stop:1993 length:414 start_codon:yes stop_codon:yes gene_type:complete